MVLMIHHKGKIEVIFINQFNSVILLTPYIFYLDLY